MYDPRYVKLVVYDADYDYITYGPTSPRAVENVNQLSYHVCTSDDLAKFDQIREADKAEVETYLDSYICIDEPERPLALNTGISSGMNGRTLYFALFPCQQTNLWFFDDPNGIHKNCIADEEIQKEYLGDLTVQILVNQDVFDINEYGVNKIRKEARIF